MKTPYRYGWAFVIVMMVVTAGFGCSQQDAGESVDAEKTAVQTVEVEKSDAKKVNKVELRFVLAKADQVDGTEDHVVSKCPGCALAMDGNEDHALEVEDYELHFCSDRCRDGFKENTAEAVMALTVPDAG